MTLSPTVSPSSSKALSVKATLGLSALKVITPFDSASAGATAIVCAPVFAGIVTGMATSPSGAGDMERVVEIDAPSSTESSAVAKLTILGLFIRRVKGVGGGAAASAMAMTWIALSPSDHPTGKSGAARVTVILSAGTASPSSLMLMVKDCESLPLAMVTDPVAVSTSLAGLTVQVSGRSASASADDITARLTDSPLFAESAFPVAKPTSPFGWSLARIVRVWVVAPGSICHGLAGKPSPSEIVKMTTSSSSAAPSSVTGTATDATDCATCPRAVSAGMVMLAGDAKAIPSVAPVALTLTGMPPPGAERPRRRSKCAVPTSSLTTEDVAAKPTV